MSKLIRQFLILLIDLYKNTISPYLGHHCRFYPTCSQYAKEQIQTHSLFLAIIKSSWRILCCWPMGDYLIKLEHVITKKINSLKK